MTAWVLTAFASSSRAASFTLNYIVTITDRSAFLPIAPNERDRRVDMPLDTAQAYIAEFNLALTFDDLHFAGYSDGGGSGARTLISTFQSPEFSAIPLPKAAPIIFAGDPGAEAIGDSLGVDVVAWRADSSSFTNTGAVSRDIVVSRALQSASIVQLSDFTSITLSGFDDVAFHLSSTTGYLAKMSEPLDFDFLTWSYVYDSDTFTADSFDYHGTAILRGSTTVAEPTTLLLVGVGVSMRLARHHKLPARRTPRLC